MFQQDAPAITKAALEGQDDLAVEAVDMFLAIIGAEAGYMGLRALATGGVYICGGITPKVCTVSMVKIHQCHLHHSSALQSVMLGLCFAFMAGDSATHGGKCCKLSSFTGLLEL